MSHKQIVQSPDPEAILAESGEIETECTQCVWPWKVLTTPPVCISQSLTVLSLLPDMRDLPFDEKVTDLAQPVCPERAVIWLPVIVLKMVIFPDLDPTAMVLFQYESASPCMSNETVREHDPHSDFAPLITLGACNSSEA